MFKSHYANPTTNDTDPLPISSTNQNIQFSTEPLPGTIHLRPDSSAIASRFFPFYRSIIPDSSHMNARHVPMPNSDVTAHRLSSRSI
ncbi:hypothetical protein TNCV_4568911 [Trichonephila clavipes]|nr:hypothetical protein TNCV_4568911 [Trichonephila clavipes]